jgi:hypothetical protein
MAIVVLRTLGSRIHQLPRMYSAEFGLVGPEKGREEDGACGSKGIKTIW